MNKLFKSQEIKRYTTGLITEYGISNIDGIYTLSVIDIPDDTLEEFASLIIRNNNEYGYEATGADNSQYEKIMQSALINLLADSSNKDKQSDFVQAYKRGVVNYLENIMQELIDHSLSDYNYSVNDKYDDSHKYFNLPVRGF